MEMFDPDMFPNTGWRRKLGELLEKEALLEKEKNKSITLVNEYEKKLKSVSEDHDYIENKANEIL